MARKCAQCKQYLDGDEYSLNQWMKAEGLSRCIDCVQNNKIPFKCKECFRIFGDENQLLMHAQVHRPRTIACPICGDTRFKSGANAVQHVESGYCTGCVGKDNARAQIYEYVSKAAPMRQFLTNAPMIGYDYGNHDRSVPDFPYKCPDCNKMFKQLSQLMQHQDQKHNEQMTLRIGY